MTNLSPPIDDLSDFTVEIADQVESFIVAIREIAAAEDPDYAISLLLLEVSQVLLAGGRLGAISDVVPEERFEPDAGVDPDVEGVRHSLANLLEPIDEHAALFDPYSDEPEVFTSRLSDDITVRTVEVTPIDAEILVRIEYMLVATRASQSVEVRVI